MQKICTVCSNSWQKETRTAEDMQKMFSRGHAEKEDQDSRGHAENVLNQDAIASLTVDRYAWRKFVIACFAAE